MHCKLSKIPLTFVDGFFTNHLRTSSAVGFSLNSSSPGNPRSEFISVFLLTEDLLLTGSAASNDPALWSLSADDLKATTALTADHPALGLLTLLGRWSADVLAPGSGEPGMEDLGDLRGDGTNSDLGRSLFMRWAVHMQREMRIAKIHWPLNKADGSIKAPKANEFETDACLLKWQSDGSYYFAKTFISTTGMYSWTECTIFTPLHGIAVNRLR